MLVPFRRSNHAERQGRPREAVRAGTVGDASVTSAYLSRARISAGSPLGSPSRHRISRERLASA